jgi:hypothetical protein
LELIEVLEKATKDEQLEKKKEDWKSVPDEALDMHTIKGRKTGRGNLFWYEVGSETVNKTEAYEKWRKWFKPLMVKLTKEKVKG